MSRGFPDTPWVKMKIDIERKERYDLASPSLSISKKMQMNVTKFTVIPMVATITPSYTYIHTCQLRYRIKKVSVHKDIRKRRANVTKIKKTKKHDKRKNYAYACIQLYPHECGFCNFVLETVVLDVV